MSLKPLKTGAAYHGNRMPHYAQQDMRDMAEGDIRFSEQFGMVV